MEVEEVLVRTADMFRASYCAGASLVALFIDYRGVEEFRMSVVGD